MASASDIGASASSYQGNAAMGGFDSGAIKIDTRPIEQLAQYSFYYNRDMWQQKQRQQDALVSELAKQSALDLNKLIPDEKEQAVAKYEDLRKEGAQLAKQLKAGQVDAIEARLQWQDKLKKTESFFNVANTRYLSKESREKQIAETTDPKMKSFLQRKLDEDIKSTSIEQPIPSLQAFDLTKAQIPKPNSFTFDVPIYDDNSNFMRNDTVTVVDQRDVNAKAAGLALGLNKLKIDKNSAEYLAKNPEDRKVIDQQQEAFEASGKLAEVAASEHYNAALKEYMVDGKLDINKLKSKNSILAGVVSTMDAYNAKMLDMQRRIDAGEFKDSTGRNYLDKNDYQPISYEDGDISAEDLLKPQILSLAEQEKRDTKITATDNKIQQDKMKQDAELAREKEANDLRIAKMKEAGENSRLRIKEAGENARAAMKGTPKLNENGEPQFGNILYSVNSPTTAKLVLPNGAKTPIKIANGVAVGAGGDPVNFTGDIKIPINYFDDSIITEYDKYVNGGKSDADGMGNKSELKKSGSDFVARFEGGVIKGLYTESGTIASDNQFAHITQVAGQAGTTKYKKPDTNYGADKPNQLAAPAKKEINRADIAAKAEAAGYTPKEYEELLKKNGITIK